MSTPKKKATKKTASPAKKTATKAKTSAEPAKKTAVKAAATKEKKPEAKKTPIKRAKRSPFNAKLRKELDQWLSAHQYWNHDDWCHLLHNLQEKSLGELTLTQEGRDSIGLYLETNREAYSA